MANSSWFPTTNEYIKYRIEVTTNNQDQANNYSNVTVKVWCYRTNTGFTTYGSGKCYCSIDGVIYSQSISTSKKITHSGTYLFSKTLNVPHSIDGSKTLACSAMINHSRFTSSYNDYTESLQSLARASSISYDGAEINQTGTITINKASAELSHTLTFSCGSESGVISTRTEDSTVDWLPPLSFARQNTSGTSVAVTISCIAYIDDIQLGTTTINITLVIPSSCVPICEIEVTDISGCYNDYEVYVKGKSRLQIAITPTLSYESPITSYSIEANGQTYSTQIATTELLDVSGSINIRASVTDGRGRTGYISQAITVYDYEVPLINSLAVTRCNVDGTDNFEGSYVRVDFACVITSLNDRNTAAYRVAYKPTSEEHYSYVTLTDYAGQYTPVGQTVIAMSADYSYDVVFTAQDAFTQSTKRTAASTGFALINWGSDGKSLGFGKLASHINQADFGLGVRFTGGIVGIELSRNTDFNDIMTAGFYIGNAGTSSYENCPITTGIFTLEVRAMGVSGQLLQALITTGTALSAEYRRTYHSNEWSDWVDILPVAHGGTGENVFPVGGVLAGNGTDALQALIGIGALYAAQDGAPEYGILPVALGGTNATNGEDACVEIGAAPVGHTHDIANMGDYAIGAGWVKLGAIKIASGAVAASSMNGAVDKSFSFSGAGFTNTPFIVLCPYCATSAIAGYVLGAYLKEASSTNAVARITSNYTGSLSVGLRWIAIGL